MDVEERLKELGIELPPPAGSQALYRSVTVAGQFAFVSGQGPYGPHGWEGLGVVGDSLSMDQGREAARLAAINFLATLRHHFGTLRTIEQIVKLTVFVRAAPGFANEHLVADGASQLLSDVLGESGLGARSAVGVADLPFGISVEIEGIVQISVSNAVAELPT